MAFKFAARTLLELGKELISSDEVALNELIKNAIDAGSPTVNIDFIVTVTQRSFQDVYDAIQDGKAIAPALDRLAHSVLVDAPQKERDEFLAQIQSARTLSKPKALAALKNAYDETNRIIVKDAGHGMSKTDLQDIYLTVGTRSRRRENIKGATYLGDKGVGRLSAMRLGERLRIESTTHGETSYSELFIDWERFGHDIDADVSAIEISPTRGRKKQAASDHGTSITISSLSATWTVDRLNEILTGPIARLIDPFVPGQANKILKFTFNGKRLLVPSIPIELLEAAHATMTAKLTFEDKKPILKGEIAYALRRTRQDILLEGTGVYGIAQDVTKRRGKKGDAADLVTPIRPEVLRALGPFEVEVYWYNRLIVEAIQGLTKKMADTRDLIVRWSGGPMLYRHGFRILPFGNPDDDWIQLDKAAFGQSGFKLNRQQVIGRVTIHSQHTALSEQTNREGLVDSPVASALQAILEWLFHSEMRTHINMADKAALVSRKKPAQAVEAYRESATRVKLALDQLKDRVPPSERMAVERLEKHVDKLTEQTSEIVDNTEDWAKDSKDDREKFVHLAGIGLLTEFIFHELERSVKQAIDEIQEARKTHPRLATLKVLEDQLVTLNKRISAFDAHTGERRQTKSLLDVREVVDSVCDGHTYQFKREKIKIEIKQDKSWTIKAVRGMLIQILENLITNSVYWLRHERIYDEDFKPSITVEISAARKTISVSDNGPGVPESRSEIIFHPFVTTKPTKQGKGLGLYISKELAEYHNWKLKMDSEAEPVHKGKFNTFVLEMGEAN